MSGLLDYFNKYIKPANDALGEQLKVKVTVYDIIAHHPPNCACNLCWGISDD
jgi:hypothetical protein